LQGRAERTERKKEKKRLGYLISRLFFYIFAQNDKENAS
jgi:hypothetical protein